MHIECPSCHSNNCVEFGYDIQCYQCKTSFGDYSFKKTKKLITITSCYALLIGVCGANIVDDVFFDEQRYPMRVEYEIINACVNGNRALMPRSYYREKTELCVCALEKTMSEGKYNNLGKSELEFLAHFRENVTLCR